MSGTGATPGGRAALVAIALLVGLAGLVFFAVMGDDSGVGREAGRRPEAGAKEDGNGAGPGWLRRDIDLVAQVAKYTAAHAGATDLSAQFYGDDRLSVHLHMMAPGQFCPLHHHPEGYELSAIVEGAGFVRGDGPSGLEENQLAPGDVVVSTKHSRHEFGNGENDKYLAALVVATPRFEGNLYVRESAPRGSGQSALLPAPGQRPGYRDIPFAPWTHVQRHVVDQPTRLPSGGTLVIYVRQGRGALGEPGSNQALRLSAPQVVVTRDAPELLVSSTGELRLEVVTLHIAAGREVAQ